VEDQKTSSLVCRENVHFSYILSSREEKSKRTNQPTSLLDTSQYLDISYLAHSVGSCFFSFVHFIFPLLVQTLSCYGDRSDLIDWRL
jgi:hypothetical protein